MGVLLIGAMGQSLLLQLKSQRYKIKFLRAYNPGSCDRIRQDLANGVIQIVDYDYIGYLCTVSPKTSLQEPKAMQRKRNLL